MALLLLPVLCLVGLIGNCMVCIAIATDRRLHNVTNYFLFSLALADLLVCLLVMPLSIIVEVRNGVWTWNVLMCLLYVYADVFLCSASIVHMSVISLDRYLGISQPLRTRNKSKTMIFVEISLVWIITLIISCPIAVLAFYDNANILKNNSCMIFNRQYIIYGSTLTFLIPFCVMFVTYLRTTSLLNKQASILSQKADDSVNGNGLRRTMPHRKLGYVRTNSASNTTCTNGTLKPIKYSNSMRTNPMSYSNEYQPSISEVEIPKIVTNNDVTNNQKDFEKRSILSRWKSRTSYYISSIALRVARRNSLQVFVCQNIFSYNRLSLTITLSLKLNKKYNCRSSHDRDRTISVNGRDDHNNNANCNHQESRESEIENRIRDKSKKISLPNMPADVNKLVIRNFRAATVEIGDDDISNEQKPLIPLNLLTTFAMKKSFTALLSPNTNGLKKSLSYVDKPSTESMETSDTEDTLTSSSNNFSHHFTLFSYSFSKPVKETFL
uniref:G_PROTEIN_RECEP_F1_2 domain-containing protein n=1 Tax=Heterorhabditis bacteriophora TaxID=37862 RepID=A0A1I7XLD9_HETBA